MQPKWKNYTAGFMLAALLSIPSWMQALASEETSSSMGGVSLRGEQFRLKLHHLHTGENISVVYRIGNSYLPEGLQN